MVTEEDRESKFAVVLLYGLFALTKQLEGSKRTGSRYQRVTDTA